MTAKIRKHNGIEYIKYAGLYKLRRTYIFRTTLRPLVNIHIGEYCTLTRQGLLIVCAGYIWDGPSGPTIDTKNFMRGSLGHDPFYQGLREGCFVGLIPNHDNPKLIMTHRQIRLWADEFIYDIVREDGMSYIRSHWVYGGLRVGGHIAAKPGKKWRAQAKLNKNKLLIDM